MVQEAKDAKTAVDATYGRRTRAVLIMTLLRISYLQMDMIMEQHKML